MTYTQVETMTHDNCVQLTVGGELDTATAERFIRAGQDAIAGRRHTTLAITMSAVTFIDAAGVGALIAIRNDARHNDNLVAIAEPARCVRRILHLTALTMTFSPAEPSRRHA